MNQTVSINRSSLENDVKKKYPLLKYDVSLLDTDYNSLKNTTI
jgi:hypothetical protein